MTQAVSELDVWIPDDTREEYLDLLGDLADLHRFPTGSVPSGPLGRGDMLVAGHHVRSVLAAIPLIDDLKVVQTFSAGVDTIVDAIPEGITLCNATGVHDVGVAEWIVMAIIASNRDLPRHLERQRAGTWGRERVPGEDLDGATVLIVGHGSIGQAVEQRLAPFGAKFVRVARRGRDGIDPMESLASLVADADVVISLLPLTSETRGVFDAGVFARMRPRALFVNASRGGVADTDALVGALGEHRIRAALDVTDPEPLPDGHPLWTAPGVLITPHIAGDVRHEEDRAWQLVLDQIRRLSRGDELRNVVVDGY